MAGHRQVANFHLCKRLREVFGNGRDFQNMLDLVVTNHTNDREGLRGEEDFTTVTVEEQNLDVLDAKS